MSMTRNKIKEVNLKVDMLVKENNLISFKKWVKENKQTLKTRNYALLRKYYNEFICKTTNTTL